MLPSQPLPHPSRQDDTAERLIKLATADCTYVQQQIATDPGLLTLADRLGNRLLHHAACAHNFPLLFHLCQTAEVDRTVKNNNGESAADWLRDYALNTHHVANTSSTLDPLWQKVAAGDVAFVTDMFHQGRESRAMRSIGGDTLLHWAAYHHQWAIVKVLLQGISAREVAQLLAIQNCYGATAFDVAQAALKRGGAAAQAVMHCLQAQQSREDVAASAAHHRPSHPLQTLPPVDASAVLACSQRFIQGVKAHDLVQMDIYLPTLCQLAYLVCQQALCLLQGVALARAGWKQQDQVRRLLAILFHKPLDMSLVSRLEQDIAALADFFLHCYSQPKRYLVFVDKLLGDERRTRYGGTLLSEGKIYLNLVNIPEKINLIRLVKTLIHEATHLVRYSFDFLHSIYDHSVDGSYRINFSVAEFLARNGSPEAYYRPLITKNKFVASVALALLEGQITSPLGLKITVDAQNQTLYEPQWTDYSWLSSRNADTIAVIVMALAAINSGQGRLDIPNMTLSIPPTFFSASQLERYQATRYVPCDLPSQLPPLQRLKLCIPRRSAAQQTLCSSARPAREEPSRRQTLCSSARPASEKPSSKNVFLFPAPPPLSTLNTSASWAKERAGGSVGPLVHALSALAVAGESASVLASSSPTSLPELANTPARCSQALSVTHPS